MKSARPDMSFKKLDGIGRWHGAALQQFEETLPLIEEFNIVHQVLISTNEKVVEALNALLGPRMAIALGELKVDKVIRKVSAGCQMIDGGRGVTFRAVFPNGMTPVVQKTGARQVDEIDALNDRVKGRSLGDNETLAPILTELNEECDKLRDALKQRKAAYSKLSEARSAHMEAREDFCSIYDKDIGLIRSLFPRDRSTQEFFFERGDSRSEKPTEDTEEKTD